jgi:MFS superfamily sulfate permease-like transporter
VNVPEASSVGNFFSNFSFPDFGRILDIDIWITAFTIAVVASLETLLSVEATDKLDPKKRITNTNRELIAQGSGNLVSGLIGGLPVTQVILRSSANIQSGAKTKLSAILHGFLLLICITTIPNILNLVPLSVLAAILFVIGFKLVNPDVIREVYKLGWSQFAPFIATVLGVVFTDLLTGLGIGVAVSVAIILRNSFKNSHFLHREESNGSRLIKMTLAEEVFFLNKGAILSALNNVPEGSNVTIDLSKTIHVDYDVVEIINDFKARAIEKKIEVNTIDSKVSIGKK